MRLDAITVVLRPRSAWEAVELGTALVRRHAGAVWRPWLAVTVPAFVAVNVACALLGLPVAAGLVMWWLKPLFDRLPLFVLSRAVFGDVPDTRTTLRGAFRGGPGLLVAHLTWRRLGPARALMLPVDVLEGGSAAQARERRRVLGGPAYGIATLCLAAFAAFEGALLFGLAALVFLFVPDDFLKSSLTSAWRYLREAPAWLVLLQNLCMWIATSVLEPFYVGTGFGQYLNRRTEIEGWDIELAFRRLRERLLAAAGTALLVAVLAVAPRAVHAAPPTCAAPAKSADGQRIPRGFGADYRDPAAFERAADRAFADPRLHPRRRVMTWEPKHPAKDRPDGAKPEWLQAFARIVAVVGKVGLWAIAAGLVLLLVATARHWWPWLRSLAPAPQRAAAKVEATPVATEAPLPDDIAGTARRLWAAGQHREALALAYRAGVAAMLEATGRVLPPGATEAQCLRAAQALPEAPRRAFATLVSQWQYAAWAERLPSDDDFEAALAQAAASFGWRA